MRIELTGLSVWAHHGVLPHETTLGQTFLVDVVLDAAVDPVADDLAETIDYGAVAETVDAVVAGPPRQLIETVAKDVLAAVRAHDERIVGARVRVHKPSAPLTVPAAAVAVTVGWGTLGDATERP